MKITLTTIAAAAALALGAPVAVADPDGYQPQLKADTSDVVSRMLDNPEPDVIDRLLQRQSAPATVATDAFDRSPLHERPGRLGSSPRPGEVDQGGLAGIGLAAALAFAAALGAACVAVAAPVGRMVAHR